MLKVGDLIYFKDYFCEIFAIQPDKSGESRFDILKIHRKYRSDGRKMKAKWTSWVYRCWAKSPDEKFNDEIKERIQLLEVYKNLTNGSMCPVNILFTE